MIPRDMQKKAEEVADRIKGTDFIKIVSHIDADGITAAAVASQALKREGIDHEVEFLKQLDPEAAERLRSEGNPLVWFTDLGSGLIDHLGDMDCIICDHHEIPDSGAGGSPELSEEQITDILAFTNAYISMKEGPGSAVLHLNPHLFGRDGARDISGAGVTYLVGRALSPENKDLAALAIVGAVGDLQSKEARRLTGSNKDIVREGIEAGVVRATTDIDLFGRETRPVHKLLQYSSEPSLPGLTGHKNNSIAFLEELGVPQKDGERWLAWTELELASRQKILSALAVLLIEKGFGHRAAQSLIGEVYELINEEENTELHEAKEFSTLLNSCGRYDKAHLGYRVCMGDRDEGLEKALNMLRGHRRNLVNSLNVVREMGLTSRDVVQYLDAGDKIPDGIIGIVTNMLLGQKGIDRSMPIISFANSQDDVEKIKVSARATPTLVRKSLKLNEVMMNAAESVGGVGGGHKIAAGATIPVGSKEEFLRAAEDMIRKQLAEGR